MKKSLVFLALAVLALLIVGCAPTTKGEGSMAGEAVQSPSKLVSPAEIRTPVYISFAEIRTHYGNENFMIQKTANQVCTDMRYKGCLMGEFREERTYFESTDGTCTTRQIAETESKFGSCNSFPIPYTGCQRGTLTGLAEPEKGDQGFSASLVSVICFK